MPISSIPRCIPLRIAQWNIAWPSEWFICLDNTRIKERNLVHHELYRICKERTFNDIFQHDDPMLKVVAIRLNP